MALVDLQQTVEDLDASLSSIENVLDPEAKKAEIADLERQVAVPNLWDDQENAQRVTSRLSALQAEIERLERLRARIEDVHVLLEFAAADDDKESLAEATTETVKLREEIDALEVRTLLSGQYDEREAVVTIRSEAGGVDAADFAEMLLRMYLRWSERHGYKVEILDTSYAEEAGIKSATFVVHAPSPTALFRSSRAPTVWCALVPSTTRGAVRHPLPVSRCCPSLRRPTTSTSQSPICALTSSMPRALVARV